MNVGDLGEMWGIWDEIEVNVGETEVNVEILGEIWGILGEILVNIGGTEVNMGDFGVNLR